MPGTEFTNDSWVKKEQILILFLSAYFISSPTGLYFTGKTDLC